jgi:hypothetical protein
MKLKTAQPWMLPPIIKVYEALGAIADGRVRIADARHATVASSDGRKTYDVEVEGQTVSSNDNASYWQGYLGYPAIAVLIARGELSFFRETAEALRGIPWKELNRRFRNDYARTLAEVWRVLEERGADPMKVHAECEATLEALQSYAPLQGTRHRPAQAK